ncbi:hypothetical protein [Polyangium sp. 6x1]|uniref:hypothetical protein n=1 Tax=Polyangium sp. 6x1 TaxID=3042689 RepID=UPI002482AC1B|nr:hypothetical protein [Polyangium sp. 6x1]MDI1450807.1 hypothetical protein [Polyangium sp. 6x1]
MSAQRKQGTRRGEGGISSGREALIIDGELQALIPRLSAEELAQLEQNLLAEGCREKLIAWDDGRQKRLLDGHNRLAICKRHGLAYEVEYISLPDREAAIQWMLKHQLGRRNLTREAMSYLRGRMYLSAKRQGARTDLTSGQSVQRSTTAELIAVQYKVDEKTIRRDARFAEELDQFAEACGAQIKNEVLAREARITRKDVPRLIALEKASREQVVAGVRGGAKASVLLREIERGGGEETQRKRRKFEDAAGGMSAALEHLEKAVGILRGLEAASGSEEILKRLDEVQVLSKEIERHRVALQRLETSRVDVFEAAQAVFELESEGILKPPLMTGADAVLADPADRQALRRQLAEVKRMSAGRTGGASSGSSLGRSARPANDVVTTSGGRLLSWKTFNTLQWYLARQQPTMERIYNACGKTRTENPADARICEKIDRFLESVGPQIIDDSFSYTDYLGALCADRQAYQDALRVMGQEILAYLRTLNRSSAQILQGRRHPTTEQSSPPAVATGGTLSIPFTQPPKQPEGAAPPVPSPRDVPARASAAAVDMQVVHPSVTVAKTIHVEPNRLREHPTEAQIEQEVSQLIDDLQSGRLRHSFQAEQAIRQKNWPQPEKDKALNSFFGRRGKLLIAGRTTMPSDLPQPDSAAQAAVPLETIASPPLPASMPPRSLIPDAGVLSTAMTLLARTPPGALQQAMKLAEGRFSMTGKV